MSTISSILYLILFGCVGGFIAYISLGFAGLPGNIIAGNPETRSLTRFKIGTLIATIGQAYVYLAYAAFIVAWTDNNLSSNNAVEFLVWMFAFLAVQLPIMIGSAMSTVHERSKNLPYANPLVEGLYLVAIVTFICFFVFVFSSTAMQTLWGWVPYVSK